MSFDYDQCRSVLFESLTNAIAKNRNRILEFQAKKQDAGHGSLTAVSCDVLPWDPFVAISFRTSDEDDTHRYEPGSWKGAQLIGAYEASESIGTAIQFVGDWYESVSTDPIRCQEVNHLIQLATADVLLDPVIAELLQNCGVNAQVIGDEIPYQEFACFEYVVVDDDRVFNANYCEMICAIRVAERLLERRINTFSK